MKIETSKVHQPSSAGAKQQGANRHEILMLHFFPPPQERGLIKNTSNTWLLAYRHTIYKKRNKQCEIRTDQKKESPSFGRLHVNDIFKLKLQSSNVRKRNKYDLLGVYLKFSKFLSICFQHLGGVFRDAVYPTHKRTYRCNTISLMRFET